MEASSLRRLGCRTAAFAAALLICLSAGLGGRGRYPRTPRKKPPPPLDVRVETDVPGTAVSRTIRACRSGRSIFVVWADERNGEADIYFNRSRDGGRTWLADDIRIENDAPGAHRSGDPEIRSQGNRVYVVWEDARNGRDDIYFNVSTNGGATWRPVDRRLDTDAHGAASSSDPLIRCFGSTVHVVYEDDRDGARDVYYRRSVDHGATWEPEVRVNTNGAGASRSDRPRMTVSRRSVYVTWHDNRNGEQDIYVNASHDAGASWFGEDRRLDTDEPGAGISYDPDIAASGRLVYVTWGDIRQGEPDVHANASVDGGRTWLRRDRRLNTDRPGVAKEFRPQIACRGPNVYVVWVDHRAGLADIHFNRSSDCGATWLREDVRIDTDAPGTGHSEYVKIALDGRRIFVAWEDDRDGLRDIRCSYSVDGGRRFLAGDLRMDTDAAGMSDSVFPRIVCGDGDACILWMDRRDGSADVYSNTLSSVALKQAHCRGRRGPSRRRAR